MKLKIGKLELRRMRHRFPRRIEIQKSESGLRFKKVSLD